MEKPYLLLYTCCTPPMRCHWMACRTWTDLNWLLRCNVWTAAAGAVRVDVSDSAIKSASAASTVTVKGDGPVLNRWPTQTWSGLENRSYGSTDLPKIILYSILCYNRILLRFYVFPMDLQSPFSDPFSPTWKLPSQCNPTETPEGNNSTNTCPLAIGWLTLAPGKKNKTLWYIQNGSELISMRDFGSEWLE